MTYSDIYDIGGGYCSNEECTLSSFGKYVIIFSIVMVLIVMVVVMPTVVSTRAPVINQVLTNNDNTTLDTTVAPVDIDTDVPPIPDPGASNNFENKYSNFIDPFTNDLPYQLQKKTVKLTPDDDYSEVLKTMSLDQDVINQHNQYVNDRNKITSTASFAPSRSDNQDIVTTWGLAKPTYVTIDPSARNVPSQDPEQGSKPIRLQWK